MGVIEAFQQRHDSALAGTTSSNQCDGLPRQNLERNALENRDIRAGRIAEENVFELDFPGSGLLLQLVARLVVDVNLGHAVDQFQDLGAGGTRGSRISAHAHRPRQHNDGVEGDEKHLVHCVGRYFAEANQVEGIGESRDLSIKKSMHIVAVCSWYQQTKILWGAAGNMQSKQQIEFYKP